MNKELLEKFIEFLEEYIDEEIIKDERYKALRKKCADLSLAENIKEYQLECEKLDYLYRHLMCEKLLLCFGEFSAVFGG